MTKQTQPPVPRTQTATPRSAHSSAAQFSGRQWQQVLARDSTADGQFVYAVKSTRVYCRPGCPSRRPARRNVSFFPTPAAARQAGFRPCMRCDPDAAAPRSDPQAPLVSAAVNHLTANPTRQVSPEELARATGATRLTVLRAFRRVLGVSPREYGRTVRLNHFAEALRPEAPSAATPQPRQPVARRALSLKTKSITEAIYQAGFGSSSRLYESSSHTLGMTPARLRKGGEGVVIRYTTAPCPLGRALVAATDVGICAISFAATDSAALAELRTRFPKARIEQDRNASGWLAKGVAYVVSQTSEHPLAADFPLDVRATAFQQRVWKALQQIPRGETRSYADVARQLGHATAVRAVGAAIGSNPLALVVPCHRVIGSNGSLTGYRWGLDRKRALLTAEGCPPASSRRRT